MMKKGTANPNTYANIYNIAALGLVAANAITDTRIGPEQGVQPAANPMPIKIEPK